MPTSEPKSIVPNKRTPLQEIALRFLEGTERPDDKMTSEICIAMLDLLDPDPWMNEPWTAEEKALFANPDGEHLVEWK